MKSRGKIVAPLLAKGQFGARDLEEHHWKLPIPNVDHSDTLHKSVAQAGDAAAAPVALQLEQLKEKHGPKFTVTIARRELREWLRESAEGKAVEESVGKLLGRGSGR